MPWHVASMCNASQWHPRERQLDGDLFRFLCLVQNDSLQGASRLGICMCDCALSF